MPTVSCTEFRRHLAMHMASVCDSREPLRVTRRNARPVIVISEEEYDSIMETLHLLRNPANVEHLLRSIENAEAGRFTEHELVEDAVSLPQ
jgi:antitoxin YefM